MGLEDTQIIDMMTGSLEGVTDGLEMMIVDAGSVEDDDKRYEMLLDKLSAYTDWVMSEEFATEYPRTSASDVLIRVLCATPPSSTMLRITGVYPDDNRQQRIRVLFEDVDEFMSRFRQRK